MAGNDNKPTTTAQDPAAVTQGSAADLAAQKAAADAAAAKVDNADATKAELADVEAVAGTAAEQQAAQDVADATAAKKARPNNGLIGNPTANQPARAATAAGRRQENGEAPKSSGRTTKVYGAHGAEFDVDVKEPWVAAKLASGELSKTKPSS